MNEKDRCHWTSYILMLYFVVIKMLEFLVSFIIINKDLRFVLASASEFHGRNVTIGEWLNIINKLTALHATEPINI